MSPSLPEYLVYPYTPYCMISIYDMISINTDYFHTANTSLSIVHKEAVLVVFLSNVDYLFCAKMNCCNRLNSIYIPHSIV